MEIRKCLERVDILKTNGKTEKYLQVNLLLKY